MHNFHSINRTQYYAFNTKSQVLLSTAIMVMLTYFVVNPTPTPWTLLLFIILLLQEMIWLSLNILQYFLKYIFWIKSYTSCTWKLFNSNKLTFFNPSQFTVINQLVGGKVDLGSKQDPVLFVCDWTKNWHFPPVILKLIFKQWEKGTNKSKSNTWKVMFWLKFLNRE